MRSIFRIGICILSLIVISTIVCSVPTPHGVSGLVYTRDSVTQMPRGTYFSIENIATGDTIEGVTGSGPYPGKYIASVDGTSGNQIIITARWNSTVSISIPVSLQSNTQVNLILDMDYPDKDYDGIIDSDDFCPNTPQGEISDNEGCSCSQKTCYDSNPCTDDYCLDSVCIYEVDDTNLCGNVRDCLEDSCLGEQRIDYPIDSHDYCNDGICVEYSCEQKSSTYDYDCDTDDDDDTILDTEDDCFDTPEDEIVDIDGCSCSQKTCSDSNPCTDDSCFDSVCIFTNNNSNTCGISRNCESDGCYYDVNYDYPEDGTDYCDEGSCIEYSCDVISQTSCPSPDVSHGGSVDLVKEKIVTSFRNIAKDDTASFKINREDIGIINLDINVNKEVENAKIVVEKVKTVFTPTKKVYQYLKITKKNIEGDDIKDASIRFKVLSSWVKKQNADYKQVVLKRLVDDKWEDLSTSFLGNGGKDAYYSAKTPGFSYFAISISDEEVETETGIISMQQISGIIYEDNKQVSSGTEITITNTVNNAVVSGVTGMGPQPGAFSFLVKGNIGDKIIISVKDYLEEYVLTEENFVEIILSKEDIFVEDIVEEIIIQEKPIIEKEEKVIIPIRIEEPAETKKACFDELLFLVIIFIMLIVVLGMILGANRVKDLNLKKKENVKKNKKRR